MPQLIHGHNFPLVECIYRLNESIRAYVGIVYTPLSPLIEQGIV